MTSKRYVKLPKDVEKTTIDSIPDNVREFEYDKLLEEDFQKNRAEYMEVELYGVMVKVKVKVKVKS